MRRLLKKLVDYQGDGDIAGVLHKSVWLHPVTYKTVLISSVSSVWATVLLKITRKLAHDSQTYSNRITVRP